MRRTVCSKAAASSLGRIASRISSGCRCVADFFGGAGAAFHIVVAATVNRIPIWYALDGESDQIGGKAKGELGMKDRSAARTNSLSRSFCVVPRSSVHGTPCFSATTR